MPEPSRHVSHPSISPWRPLRIPLFRNLLIADLVSDIGAFMQTVGAAWLMTTLTSSSLYIALIQTASALPFFLLALPAGSIGDIFDRRKLILGTETWMFAIAMVLAVVTFTGAHDAVALAPAYAGSLARRRHRSSDVARDIPRVGQKGRSHSRSRAERNRVQPGSRRGPGTGGSDHRGCRRCDRFPPQCAFIFGSDLRHLHVETSRAEKRIAGGNARRSQRCGDSLRPLLARNPHAAGAIGNRHLFRQLLFGSSAGGRKGTEQERTRYGFLLGFFGAGAVLGAVVLQRAGSNFPTEAMFRWPRRCSAQFS